jgi:N-acetyltransferase
MAREVTAERGCVEAGLLDRYLQLLGVPRKEPGLEALSELVFAHLTRVPFENISKLYRWKRQGQTTLPVLPQFLEGIEQCHFGGTCYSNNFHFYTLLAELEYDVKLCAADMSTPDVHMVSVVRIDGHEYLVDAGYAAPFLSPMPLDLSEDYVLHLGRDQYLLKPNLEAWLSDQSEAADNRGLSAGDHRLFPINSHILEFDIAGPFLAGSFAGDPQPYADRIARAPMPNPAASAQRSSSRNSHAILDAA